MDEKTDREFDTTDPRGFAAARWHMNMTAETAACLLGVNERSLKRWESGKTEVSPTAAKVLDWMLEGWRPREWYMTGEHMADLRLDLGLTEDQLATVLDVETELLIKWESDDRGPPRIVAKAIYWLIDGYRPSGWPTDAGAA